MEPVTVTWATALQSASTMNSAPTIKTRALAIEGIVISEDSAVGFVVVVIETNVVMVPIISPVVPAPAKTAEKADAKTETEGNSRSGKV